MSRSETVGELTVRPCRHRRCRGDSVLQDPSFYKLYRALYVLIIAPPIVLGLRAAWLSRLPEEERPKQARRPWLVAVAIVWGVAILALALGLLFTWKPPQ